MINDSEIKNLFKNEQNRVHEKEVPGFYITESEYEGTNVYDEI